MVIGQTNYFSFGYAMHGHTVTPSKRLKHENVKDQTSAKSPSRNLSHVRVGMDLQVGPWCRTVFAKCSGRNHLVAVTGSLWLLRRLRDCNWVYVPLFFAKIALHGSYGTLCEGAFDCAIIL